MPPSRPKKNDPDPMVWVTAQGKEIKIWEMTDTHLVNTIRYLRRRAEAKVTDFALSPNPFRGEMARDSFDDAQLEACFEPDAAAEAILEGIPQWPHLLGEAKRRKLKVD